VIGRVQRAVVDWNTMQDAGVLLTRKYHRSGHGMWQQRRLVILIVVGCLTLAGYLSSACIPAFWDGRAVLRTQLDQAERKWNERGITSYRIVVSESNSIWHSQDNTVVVVGGQVAEQSARCIMDTIELNSCPAKPFDAARFTVPALFATCRSALEMQPMDVVRVELDETYGFPLRIVSDRRDPIDGDHGWQVESFTPL